MKTLQDKYSTTLHVLKNIKNTTPNAKKLVAGTGYRVQDFRIVP